METANTAQTKFKAIGLMSGTSLDGLDMAAVEFIKKSGRWQFQLVHSQTLPYADEWMEVLKSAPELNEERLYQLDSDYGNYLGEATLEFMQTTKFAPDLIASHGHTVFHQPEKGYTLQIGNGANIAASTHTLTVSDFRTGDVALGGQGAPLVPIGDKLLFSDYDYCLNLGGFANISFDKDNKRLAYDICPVNFILNHYANKKGMAYDKDGILGRRGKVSIELLNRLNDLPFYKMIPPKSLGREWVENNLFTLLHEIDLPDSDVLSTLYEHIAVQISNSISGEGKVLLTGGGALNQFLVDRIKDRCNARVIIPEIDIIDFKEAIIFAFLGVLRTTNTNNCLASVTGAAKDSCGGVIHSFK